MRAIVYVCHGTRIRAGNQQSKMLAEACMKQCDAPIQEVSYLELASPTIPETLEICRMKGATEITIMPLLLLNAGHAKRDIPNEVEAFQKKNPGISIQFASPIGIHEKMIDILVEKIEEKRVDKNEDIGILVIGRGSHDPDSKNDLQHICTLLQKRNHHYHIVDGYLTASSPHYTQALETLEKKYHSIYLIPYLLFTGLLMKEIAEEVKLRKKKHFEYKLCSFIGSHPNVIDVIVERINEKVLKDAY